MGEISIEILNEMADFMGTRQILEAKTMKILSLLRDFFVVDAQQHPRHESETRWVIDPLSHPVLDTMSERELGDVPFRLTARRTVHETASLHAGFGGRC